MFANEYTKIIQRFINLSQLFGLAPMTINLPLSVTLTTSQMKFLMSTFCMLFQLGHGIFQVMKIYDQIRISTMSQIIHFVWMFHCLFTNICVAVQSLLISSHLVAYINQLIAIDEEINTKLKIVRNYQRQSHKHLLITIVVLAMSFGLSWTLYGCVTYFHPQLVSLFAFIFIPTGFMAIRVFQLIHSIELLNDHLDTINDRLTNIEDNQIEVNGKEDLIALRRLYGQCWNAMQLYNSCFGFSNVMLLLFYSYDVLHGVYTLFLNMHGLRPDLAILCKSNVWCEGVTTWIIFTNNPKKSQIIQKKIPNNPMEKKSCYPLGLMWPIVSIF